MSKDIRKLKLGFKVIDELSKNGINTIEELWNLKRSDLKNMKFSNDEINLIIIELQLIGLDLNRKKY